MNQTHVFGLLAASAPFEEHAEKLMLYGQFVGSWDIDSAWFHRNGETRKGKGEWHFAWILGGRGIQDVFVTAGAPPHQYSTTIRCYDRAIDVWRITRMQPYCGEFIHMLGRRVGNRIVQEGKGNDIHQRLRWSFDDITPNSFLWLGEVSDDDGETWIIEQAMRATRRP